MGNETIRRRNLPHWDVANAAYFVTTCLEGSIPARGLLDLVEYRTQLRHRRRPKDVSEKDTSFGRRRWRSCVRYSTRSSKPRAGILPSRHVVTKYAALATSQ